MPHNFDDKQKIDQGNLAQATGPVDHNQQMFWIAAFIWQNDPASGRYAAASGEAKWPNGIAGKWVCPMQKHPDSDSFEPGAAKAWALARVTNNGGDFYGWVHPVELK